MLVLFCVSSFFIYTPLSLDVFKWCFFFSLFCVISYVLRMWRQRHFSIFELLKSSFIEAEVSDVINYILIHVNSLKQKTMASF